MEEPGKRGAVMERAILMVMALSLAAAPGAVASPGGGEPGTAAEVADYAARETEAPELVGFGGGAHEFEWLLGLVALCLYVYLSWAVDKRWHGHDHGHH